MADDGFPYPGVSQIETAVEWETFFRAVQLDGVVSGLVPSINSGARTASVGAGGAYLRGFYKPVSSTTATAVPAAAGQDRVDRLVLRLDRDAANTAGYIVPTVLTGTAGTVTPPTLSSGSTGTWDLPISRWTSRATGALTGLVDERYGPGWFTAAARAAGLVPASPARVAVEIGTGQVLRSDGSAWVVLHEDTGWVGLTLNGPNGNAWTNNVVSRVRRRSGHVHLRISVRRWNDSALGLGDDDGSVPFILPAGFRPAVQEVGAGFHSRSPVAVRIEPDGSVRIFPLESDVPAGRTVLATADYFV